MCQYLGVSLRAYACVTLASEKEGEAMASPRTPHASLGLALCALAVLAGLAFIQPAKATTSEEFTFRIAARLHENGTHLEFGIQRIDAQGEPRLLHLGQKRFVDLTLGHHRWLTGDYAFFVQAPYYDEDNLHFDGCPAGIFGAEVKPVARIHPTRNQVEFGATWKLDASQLPNSDDDAYADPVFPAKRFFPRDVDHHRWLYSAELRFTRIWAGDDTMDAAATMQDDGSKPEHVTPPPPSIADCLFLWDPTVGAMVNDECDNAMATYCEDDPDHPSCVFWREYQRG